MGISVFISKDLSLKYSSDSTSVNKVKKVKPQNKTLSQGHALAKGKYRVKYRLKYRLKSCLELNLLQHGTIPTQKRKNVFKHLEGVQASENLPNCRRHGLLVTGHSQAVPVCTYIALPLTYNALEQTDNTAAWCTEVFLFLSSNVCPW